MASSVRAKINQHPDTSMDRFIAMVILLGLLVIILLITLALFAVAPIVCSCMLTLIYTLYLFMAYEDSGVHHAQENENRFWTIFALLFSTAIFFADDSPVAFGRYSPSLGFFGVVVSSYAMHIWDRYMHRIAISRQAYIRRTTSHAHHLSDSGVPVESHLLKIDESLRDIDRLLVPSTINNLLNRRFVLRKEREIISIFYECDAVTLNHLLNRVKLGLLIYKIKDHRSYLGQHRTELIQLLAVERLAALTVMSRVIVLHALQMLKLRANPRAEQWVRNVILNTTQDNLSEIKTLTDAKGDYFCMKKLIYDDIRSESVRRDILNHVRKEATVLRTHLQLGTLRAKRRKNMAWRKVLSDVDDTLCCSGGSYPAGMDRRFPKKAVYPGVLAFYRELDLGTNGPEEWPENRVGNLVFLSARPHVYKDISEKSNFAKFEKLRLASKDGRKGMHTTPSLLAGDIVSGSQFFATNDCEPLARKKFDNFKKYVSIYPEYQHVFVCDNGQGDVKAGEMMFDSFPYEFEALYVHVVQDIPRTYGYAPDRWKDKEFTPCFFRTYPEAALDAATRDPPLIRATGCWRVCSEAVKDFKLISKWQSDAQKAARRGELNQSIRKANAFLVSKGLPAVEIIEADRVWMDGERVNTPYGRGFVRGFDPTTDLYQVELDWRGVDVQIESYLRDLKEEAGRRKSHSTVERRISISLETVIESEDTELNRELLPVKDALDSVNLSPSITDESEAGFRGYQMVYASIGCQFLSAYTPPTLPKVEIEKPSAFGTLVSTLHFASRFSSTKQLKSEPDEPSFSQFYADSASVTTDFGDGTILKFRAHDGVYEVLLTDWRLADGSHPKAFLREDTIRHRTAPGCKEGYPVLTSYGLTGELKSVEPATGIHMVTVPSAGMVMYLQPSCVVRPVKAAVGEEVLTAAGNGTVKDYNAAEDTYVISLDGWNATLYAKAETFDRVGNEMSDRGNALGIRWLVRYFFSSKDQDEDSVRSRSNSIVSASRGIRS